MTISLKDDIKKELDKKCHYSEDRKNELAQWSNSFIYRRKKNGKLRLHLNTKDFNAAIQIEHHVALSLEEILLNLKDAKVFSYKGEKNADTNSIFTAVQFLRRKTLLVCLPCIMIFFVPFVLKFRTAGKGKFDNSEQLY